MFSSQEECRQACARHLETGGEKVTDEDENVLTKNVSEASSLSQIHLMALAMMARARNSSQTANGTEKTEQPEEDDISRDQELEVDFAVPFEAGNIDKHDNNEEYDIEEMSIEQQLPATDENPDHMVQLEPETNIDVAVAADEFPDSDNAEVDDEKTVDYTTTMKALAYEPDLKESVDQEETIEQLKPETGVDVEATNEKYNPHLEQELGIDIEGAIGRIDKSQRSAKLGTKSNCGIKSNYLALIVCTASILILIR